MKRANLDFSNLPFGYEKTDHNVRSWYRDGVWSSAEVTGDEYIPLHMASGCLHHGQAIIEGLKAFERPDGQVQAFRPAENALRMQHSARRLLMEPVPEELFLEAVRLAVQANRRFVPPYESGASLYIRPFEVGVSAELGLRPSKDFLFTVYVAPVGPYFKTGYDPVRILVEEQVPTRCLGWKAPSRTRPTNGSIWNIPTPTFCLSTTNTPSRVRRPVKGLGMPRLKREEPIFADVT